MYGFHIVAKCNYGFVILKCQARRNGRLTEVIRSLCIHEKIWTSWKQTLVRYEILMLYIPLYVFANKGHENSAVRKLNDV